jgi:hypothetical protein
MEVVFSIWTLTMNWLRALQRSMSADNGKSLGTASPWAYLNDRGIGVSKAVQTVVPTA